MTACGAAGSASRVMLATNAGKSASFPAFVARMALDAEPTALHAVIDNRLTATATLKAQVIAMMRQYG